MDRGSKRSHFSFLREQRGSHSRIQGVCGIRRGSGAHVVEVGTETVSTRMKVDRRVLTADLDQDLGLITCERGLFSHSAKRATAAGIPDSVSSPSGKVERRSGRPKRLRQDMRWKNDCGTSALFSTHDSHADLNHQAFEPLQVHQIKCTYETLCHTARNEKNLRVCCVR